MSLGILLFGLLDCSVICLLPLTAEHGISTYFSPPTLYVFQFDGTVNKVQTQPLEFVDTSNQYLRHRPKTA
jgi:hypothetical protein